MNRAKRIQRKIRRHREIAHDNSELNYRKGNIDNLEKFTIDDIGQLLGRGFTFGPHDARLGRFLIINERDQLIIDYLHSLGWEFDNEGEYYDFFYYLDSVRPEVKLDLSFNEAQYLSRMPDEELHIIDPEVIEIDRASALFFLITGIRTQSNIKDLDNYLLICENLSPMVALVLDDIYTSAEEDDIIVGLYSDLSRAYSYQEIHSELDRTNYLEFAEKYGFVFSPAYFPESTYDAVVILIANISYTSPTIMGPYYGQTMAELIDIYDPAPEQWEDLATLIEAIQTNAEQWSIRHQYCNNDDTINIISGELHGETNKDDPENPTVSYGVNRNYACYQTDELEANFREIDGLFTFRNPDWRAPGPGVPPRLDPVTHDELEPDFGYYQMDNFIDNMKHYPQNQYYGPQSPLYHTIEREIGSVKINNYAAFDKYIDDLRSTVGKTQKQIAIDNSKMAVIVLFLVWFFLLGMWMRFWTGPASQGITTWPMERFDFNDPNSGRCSIADRDQHSFIQFELYRNLKKFYDNELWDRLNRLPLYHYLYEEVAPGQWQGTGIPVMGNIGWLLTKAMRGEYCLGMAGDDIVTTAYIYLNIFGDINEGLASYMEAILEEEHKVTTKMIPELEREIAANDDPIVLEELEHKLRIVKARNEATKDPAMRAVPFNPINISVMTPNKHV